MTRAGIFQALSWLAFGVGLVAVVVSAIPGGELLMGWFMIDHVLVIAICMAATFTLRRPRPGVRPLRWPGARRLFAPHLVVAAVVALSTVFVLRELMPADLLLAAGHHLRFVADDVVRMPRFAERHDSEVFGLFARAWVGFAFAGLCLWHVIGIRDEQARVVAAPVAAAATRSPAQGSAPAGQRRVVVAIWGLAMIWSAASMALWHDGRLCHAPFPWPFALFPLVVFGLSGLFAKRSPFLAPWAAEVLDARFGPGATVRFLVALKPMLLLAASAGIGSLAMARVCGAEGVGASFVPLFFASAGLGFALSHIVMRKRRVEGV
jgi:hypothetical protein